MFEDPRLDTLRKEIAELEYKLNEVSNGFFFGGCAIRGLETYTIRELEEVASKARNQPFFWKLVRTLTEKLLEFYSIYGMEPPHVILQLKRYFRLDKPFKPREKPKPWELPKRENRKPKQLTLTNFKGGRG